LAGQVDVDEDGSLLDVGHARMVHEFLQISVCGRGNLNNQPESLLMQIISTCFERCLI
jgi:hypothetical protein